MRWPRFDEARLTRAGSRAPTVAAMTHLPDAASLRAALADTGWGPISVLATTGSTNADLAASARQGAPAGTVLVATHQSAGRGRLTRSWEAPPGTSVATSVLVAPRVPLSTWGWLPLLVGVAVARGITDATGLDARLKWPNDVLIGDRKVCGILCEAVPEPPGPKAVLGFGLNTALRAEQLPVPTATSLLLEGSQVDATTVLTAVLTELEEVLRAWEGGADPRPGYRALCATLGAEVSVLLPVGDTVQGRAVDVDADGGLIVDTARGRRTFVAGDIQHLRPR